MFNDDEDEEEGLLFLLPRILPLCDVELIVLANDDDDEDENVVKEEEGANPFTTDGEDAKSNKVPIGIVNFIFMLII